MTVKHPTANEREAAKAAGIDLHPASSLPDPPQVEWARDKQLPAEARYGGGEFGAILEEAGERLTDPDELSRPTPTRQSGSSRKRLKRYRNGCVELSVDAALGHSALDSLWGGPGASERTARLGLVKGVLEAIKPRNELEGLLAAQLIGAHGAAMECYRRSMIPEQTYASRSEALTQAGKASRTFATLLEALDRHRGKGSQQRVRVEHVHVHAGGQAVVGMVEGPRGGKDRTTRQSHAKPAALTHAPESALRCQEPSREHLPVARDGERAVPNARRDKPGRTGG